MEVSRVSSTRRQALRASIALAIPTAALGVTFGVLAVPVVGVGPAVAMSLVVWSGAAQFGALSVLTGGGGFALAASTGLLANARFLPMGFALAPSLTGSWLRRLRTGTLMVDASFALAHRGGGRFDPEVVVWAAPLQYVGWLAGTLTGALGASTLVDPDKLGLDVLFPVFYLGLLVPELRGGGRHHALAALSAAVALALVPVAPEGVPVLAGAATCLLGLRRPS